MGCAHSSPHRTISARKSCGQSYSTSWCRRRCHLPVITSGDNAFPLSGGPPATELCGVIMVGPGGVDETLASLENQSGADWIAAAMGTEETPTGFQPDLMQSFLEAEGATCGYILYVLAGTVLAPNALQRIGYAFSKFEDAQAVYGDVDVRGDEEGSAWPLALPAFDYERMLEQGYCAHLFALRSPTAARCLAVGATDLYRLFNAVRDDEHTSSDDIVHLPGSLGLLPVFDRRRQARRLPPPVWRISKKEASKRKQWRRPACCFRPCTSFARSSHKA